MKNFQEFKFDPTVCRKELDEFKKLLNSKAELDEADEILPFFKGKMHLSAFIGSYIQDIVNFDRIAYEFDFFGDFHADLAIGDSQTNTFCFVEFEDAKATSVFRKNGQKNTLEWAPRFEHGYSQIVDWFWRMDDFKKSTKYQEIFGSPQVDYHGLLVIGRSTDLKPHELSRLKWRLDKCLVDSKKVFCVTFDDLFADLNDRLQFYGAAYQADHPDQ